MIKCECMELDSLGRVESDTHFLKLDYLECLKSSNQAFTFHVWRNIVKAYCGRLLTNGTDMLPALSGIASKFKDYGAGRYLAGIWRNSLPQALLWCLRGSSFRRAKPYIAPTWSWASLRRRTQCSTTTHQTYITYPLELDSNFPHEPLILAKVRETHIDPLGIDHTGAVRNGHLVLEAPLIEFSLDWKRPTGTPLAVFHREAFGRSILGAGNVETWMMDFNLYFDYEFILTRNDTVHGLLIGSVGNPRRPAGLIIRRSVVEVGSWKRMGIFVVSGARQHGSEIDPLICFQELEETTVRLV
jgi:hypothetical protein